MQRGDVVLVTGASTGIGATAAATLAKAGFVTFAGMRGPLDRPEAKALREAGCQVVELDVTSQKSCAACVEAVRSSAGRIDALINNAGVNAELRSVEDAALEDHYYVMEANYFGAVRMAQLVLPEMRVRRKGAIVNVTSCAGIFWSTCSGAYCASKAALEALSGTLAQEVGRFGIRVCTVRPGVIITPILTKSAVVPPPATSAYKDQVRHAKKFFQSQILLMQGPELVAEKLLGLLAEPGDWDAGYDVGEDAAAMSKVWHERGAEWKVREGRKERTDAELIEHFRSFGMDISSGYPKAKL